MDMKTVPAKDSALRSKPSVREAMTRAETAAADALATERQARLCKSRLKTARKNHKRARKAARKAAKRNKEAQVFLKSVLAKANIQESSTSTRSKPKPEPAAGSKSSRAKVVTSKATKKKPSAPVRLIRSKRRSRPPRKTVADAAAFQMESGVVGAAEATGLPTTTGTILAGDGNRGGT
jgi:hypothetical protein